MQPLATMQPKSGNSGLYLFTDNQAITQLLKQQHLWSRFLAGRDEARRKFLPPAPCGWRLAVPDVGDGSYSVFTGIEGFPEAIDNGYAWYYLPDAHNKDGMSLLANIIATKFPGEQFRPIEPSALNGQN